MVFRNVKHVEAAWPHPRSTPIRILDDRSHTQHSGTVYVENKSSLTRNFKQLGVERVNQRNVAAYLSTTPTQVASMHREEKETLSSSHRVSKSLSETQTEILENRTHLSLCFFGRKIPYRAA